MIEGSPARTVPVEEHTRNAHTQTTRQRKFEIECSRCRPFAVLPGFPEVHLLIIARGLLGVPRDATNVTISMVNQIDSGVSASSGGSALHSVSPNRSNADDSVGSCDGMWHERAAPESDQVSASLPPLTHLEVDSLGYSKNSLGNALALLLKVSRFSSHRRRQVCNNALSRDTSLNQLAGLTHKPFKRSSLTTVLLSPAMTNSPTGTKT